jgi:DNA polymerase I
VINPNPNLYRSNNYVVLDFETTNHGGDYGSALNPDNHTVLSVVNDRNRSFSKGTKNSLSTWGNELKQGRIIDLIERADFLVAHNAKFELQWLQRIGASIEHIVVWDTLLAEYILNGNARVALDLDSVAKRYGLGGKTSVVSLMIKNGIDCSDIPEEWLEEYCIQDVDLTYQVFLRQLEKAIELDLLPVIYTRCLACPVLADIEKNGMKLDEEAVMAKYGEVAGQVAQSRSILDRFGDGINWNSPDQVAELLYDKLGFDVPLNYRKEPMLTAGGKRSVGKDALAALKPKTDEQKEFVAAYKEWNKLDDQMTKYLAKMEECIRKDDGILYANFNQSVARTMRLTSSGKKYKIQFHNFDRKLKPLFKPRFPGWLIEEDDGASLEFRVAGHLGRDTAIIQAIREKFDVHRFTASVLNSVPLEAVTGDMRTAAKSDTFKPLYGGQSGTEAQKAYYAAFRERYPGITNTQNDWIRTVLESKQLVTETGHRFYWPTTKITRTGYITNRESICNYPVQYLATGEIIPIALIYQWHKLKARKLESFLVNTVHDSIVAEIHPDEQEVYRYDVIKSFTTDVYRYLYLVYTISFTCPLGIGTKIGYHWGKGDASAMDRDEEFLLDTEYDFERDGNEVKIQIVENTEWSKAA